MFSRKVWLGIAAGVLIGAAGLGWMISRAPQTSTVTATRCLTTADSASCIRFPTVSGQNLADDTYTLPADFAGEEVLVIVPFDEDQQVRAQSWLPLAQEIAAERADFAYYNTAIFTADINPAVRLFIRGGMVMAIPDEDLRRATITLFLEDRAAFLDALAIPDIEQTQVFLLNGAGEVLWRGVGDYTAQQGADLRATLAGL